MLVAVMSVGCQKQEAAETILVQHEIHESEPGSINKETEESITETKAAETVSEETTENVTNAVLDIDKMVGEAIIQQSQVMYPGYECVAEGHIILDSEEKDGFLTVYAQTMYGEYQFHNEEYFVKSAGSGVIPCVMEFIVNEKGAYKLYAVQWPEDGSRYVQSIQEMFPEKLWDTCISPTEEAKAELIAQERAYAEAYLKQLGRDAKIGDYADFEYVLLTEAGVPVEASNHIMEYEKD